MGVLDYLKGKTKDPTESNDIQPGDLKRAGIDIKRGDPRLKGGITKDNLSPDEKAKLEASKKKDS